MKLIFLDIDGVLTSSTDKLDNNKLYPFSPSCVVVLNQILLSNTVKIILSSSWRTVFDAEKQHQIFQENGVVQIPAGQTSDLSYDDRGLEIRQYLERRKVESFVILDDMKIEGFDSNFIQIDPRTGLVAEHIELVNEILINNN